MNPTVREVGLKTLKLSVVLIFSVMILIFSIIVLIFSVMILIFSIIVLILSVIVIKFFVIVLKFFCHCSNVFVAVVLDKDNTLYFITQ